MTELVRKAIAEQIDQLFLDPKDREAVAKARRENSPPVLYGVVTPLAEGADRIVAQAVLEYPGAAIDVVLPLPDDEYMRDFETAESKNEFLQLLAQCRRPVRLRPDDDSKESRNAAYEAAGRWVVDHCDVVIAIWNSHGAVGRGGTAEIVEYARLNRRPIIRIWDSIEAESGVGLRATSLAAIAEFNEARPNPSERLPYLANLERDYFETPKSAAGLPEAARKIVREKLFPLYVHTSLLAKQHQKLFHRAGLFVYVFSALAVAAVAIAVAALDEDFSFLAYAFEFVLLVIAWLVVRRSHGHRSQERWMENRFLAERIRSGFFLAVCGVDPTPIETPPFMGHAHEPDDWMVRAFNEAWNRLPVLRPCEAGLCPLLRHYAIEVWLDGQVKFHEEKRDREAWHGKAFLTTAKVLFFVTLGAAFVHTALHEWVHHYPWINSALTVIAIAFPAVLASIAGMRAHREHLRLEKRSESMARQLRVLAQRMSTAGDNPKEFRRILLQADEALLRETQEWLSLMRYVEIEAG
ncbi:MAG: hypothetical protein U0Q16_32960 [Bryobacteraceae bacterium]